MGKALPAVAASLWLAACAGMYDISSSSGGRHWSATESLAAETARTVGLTPACTVLAARLAEAGVRARTARFRPTARIMSRREDEAAAAWTAGMCPERALPVLYFGVAEIAARGEEVRRGTGGVPS